MRQWARGDQAQIENPVPMERWQVCGSYNDGMSEPPIQPEEVFHSTLPTGASLIVVFVPSKDRDQQPIDQDHWVDEVLMTLGRP